MHMHSNDVQVALHELNALPFKDDGEVYIGALKPLLQRYKGQHDLACALWNTKQKPARELAVRIADPQRADDTLLEQWVHDLDCWGLTDSFTGHLVKYTSHASEKAFDWVQRDGEYLRRSGFATIAQMAWAHNEWDDQLFVDFLPLIKKYANDPRLHVKKAVNWALRDIGKRNENLRCHVIRLAAELQKSSNKTRRWVGMHRRHEYMTVEK